MQEAEGSKCDQSAISKGEITAVEVLMDGLSVDLRTVRGHLRKIDAPRDLVVIAEAWPSCLISILALKLPLSGAYFPRRYHQHFKLPTNARFAQWNIDGQPKDGDNTFVISGSVAFIRRVCAYKHVNTNRVIACFKQNFKKNGKSGKFQWSDAKAMCDTLSLSPVTMRDMQFGGGTNASFLFGFGNDLDSPHLPRPQPDIQ